VCVVEWADLWDVMPADHVRIALAHDGDARELTATGTGERGPRLADAMLGFR
jgi:tRNA A37 threonylcarbamoyladenosine biosynthesis protein TsaE